MENRRMRDCATGAMQRAAGPLDPLLASLANFSSPTHLDSQIRLLFQLMDVDDSGSLSFHEMQEGMESLPLSPNVILSIEDWDSLTIGGEALDENQCMTAEAFQTAIRWQLMLYGQRLLAQRMSQAMESDSDDPTTIDLLDMLRFCCANALTRSTPADTITWCTLSSVSW